MEMQDNVAIVTGAASGIGRAVAQLFASEGASLVIADVQDEALAALAAELRATGTQCETVHCDISAEAEVEAMVEAAVSGLGGLNVLVNCAGIRDVETPFVDTDVAEWSRVLNINLTGTFLCLKHGIAAMLKSGGGSIVNVASVSGLAGDPRHVAYGASKAGVINLTRSAAKEYAKRDIRVNCVCPGYVDTPMLDIFTQASAARASFLKNLQPLGRLATPGEVADAVLYLASPRASFVTGAVLNVDGGLTA